MNLPQIIKKTLSELVFDCGCSVPFNENPHIEYSQLNKDCLKVWELLREGYTSDIFQLSNGGLGKHWSKEMECKSIDDISALIAIIRPGVLEFKENGKSVTRKITERRKGLEETTYIHESLKPILEDTNGCIIFQEQCLKIAQDIAGFTPNESDTLRKSIGKKDVKLMAELKDKFLIGCKNKGIVNDETALILFENIEKSQRYSFNKCVSRYSVISYINGQHLTIEEAFKNGCWKGQKLLSLKINERKKRTCVNDNLLKNTEVVENEIEDIKYSGQQRVYRITLKRRLITDKHFLKPSRPQHSIVVTASHKHPTRCHGILRTDELIAGVHSLYCYDSVRKYQPQYKHAASRIVKIEELGVEDVYDVTMKAPYHTFLCDTIFTCNSHSVGYGTQTYRTAWAKVHFPLEFYTANLRLNEERGGKKEKIEEEKLGMIKEAKELGINIVPPTQEFPCKTFTIKDKSTIVYGLSNIKMTGDKESDAVLELLPRCKTWLDILFKIGGIIKSASFENICLSGFFKSDISRQRMVYEYKTYRKLTNKEVGWIESRLNEFTSLDDAINKMLEYNGNDKGISRKDRIPKIEDLLKTLRNPPHLLEDTPITINRTEKDLFGVPLTYSDVEARTLSGIYTNTTCKEFNEGKRGRDLRLALSITKVKEHKTKRGEKMAFCTGQDDTQMLESIVIFPQAYEEYANLLVEKNTVLLIAEGKDKSLIVNKVIQI